MLNWGESSKYLWVTTNAWGNEFYSRETPHNKSIFIGELNIEKTKPGLRFKTTGGSEYT